MTSESDYPEMDSIVLPALFDICLNPWTEINRFSEISVDTESKTIVFCDIDDTLIHHPFLNPNWIGIIKLFFFMRNQQALGISDEKLAIAESESYLDEIFKTRPILHSDREGFFGLAEKVDKLIFITARPSQSSEFTCANLRSIDVDPAKFDVHFCNNSNKGEYIYKHFDLSKYDSMIFIDDQQLNLENVFKAFSREDDDFVKKPKLNMYKFKRLLEDPCAYYPFPPGFPSWYKFDGQFLVMANSEQETQCAEETQCAQETQCAKETQEL